MSFCSSKKTFQIICVFSVKVLRPALKLTPERRDTHDHRSLRIEKVGSERKVGKKQVILLINQNVPNHMFFSVKVLRAALKLTPERCDTHDDRTKRIQKQIPKRKPRTKTSDSVHESTQKRPQTPGRRRRRKSL